mgnify:FL=1
MKVHYLILSKVPMLKRFVASLLQQKLHTNSILQYLINACPVCFAQVVRIIQRNPPAQGQLLQYLDAHIRLDIQHLSQSCGSNRDDCILMLHEIINRMKGLNFIISGIFVNLKCPLCNVIVGEFDCRKITFLSFR